MLRVLVTGDRDWKDADFIYRALADLMAEAPPEDILIIEGRARGADLMAFEAATTLGYRDSGYPAHWQHDESCLDDCREKCGPAAGPIRNSLMLKEGRPNLVLAFHDDLEHSKGTKDMVTKARAAGVEVRLLQHVAPEPVPYDQLEVADI